MVEVRRRACSPPIEAGILGNLALIHRGKGSLRIAIKLYEDVLALLAGKQESREGACLILKDLALALIHLGDFDRAATALGRVREDLPSDSPVGVRARLELSFALLALHQRDDASCARALANAGEMSGDLNSRERIILREYTADLAIAGGRASEVIEDLTHMLQVAQAAAPQGDLIPEVARRLGTAHLESGDPARGLEYAMLAARTGATADRLEWAAGLRIAGRCHAVLGRMDDAKAAWTQAFTVLQATEFFAERDRLGDTVAAYGIEIPGLAVAQPSSGSIRSTRRPIDAASRLDLRDGRFLLTTDARLIEDVTLAASGTLPVLLYGETGTGKELVAHLLHELGPSKGPLVIVDCAAISPTLVEAELFGHLRGAFSGALTDREGLVAAADGGTLFFDELPELSLEMQATLLRLVQFGTYRRLGERFDRHARVRMIAAANRRPEALVKQGKLKRDLFFRLNAHRIDIRPLRERPADIAVLAQAFARQEGLGGVSPQADELLRSLQWRGNIRELEMVIRIAARQVAPGGMLDEAALERLPIMRARTKAPTDLRAARTQAEQAMIAKAIARNNGSVKAAARELGRSPQAIYKALKRNEPE